MKLGYQLKTIHEGEKNKIVVALEMHYDEEDQHKEEGVDSFIEQFFQC